MRLTRRSLLRRGGATAAGAGVLGSLAAAAPAAPTKAKPAAPKLRPPSEDVRPEGRKMTDAELRREALRDVGQWSAEHERRYQANLPRR